MRWREHLSEMDHLREGIHLRAVASQDPLVAWQREGYTMFERLLDSIDDDYLRYIAHIEAASPPRARSPRPRRETSPQAELRVPGRPPESPARLPR